MYSLFGLKFFGWSCLNFWVSGKNSRTAWQAFKATRRCMCFYVFSRFLWGTAKGERCATWRRKLINQVFWVLMNGLAVMNTRQATQANLCSILMFLGVLG